MNEEELEELLEISCCSYHDGIAEKAYGYIKEQQKEIEIKDKIIDLMAEQLSTPINSKGWVKEYYRKKVEECK